MGHRYRSLSFEAIDLAAKHTLIGSWSVIDDRYNNNRYVRGIADLDGDERRELIVERVNTRLAN